VVELIIENLKEPKLSEGITSLLKSGLKVIDQLAWEKINISEVISGEIIGKPRVKIADREKLINLSKF
jgi:ferredoxin--NADP+ reductase